MSLDWNKIMGKPDKEYKVAGVTLIEFKEKIAAGERRSADLDKQLADLQAVKKGLDEKIASLEKDLESTRKDASETKSSLEGKVASLEGSLKEKGAEIAALNGKIEGMQVTVGTSMKDKDAQVQRLVDEKNSLQASLEKKIETLGSEKNALAGEVAAIKNRVADMERDTKRMAEAHGKLQKEKAELEANLKIMDEQLAARDFDYFKKLIKQRAERAAASFDASREA